MEIEDVLRQVIGNFEPKELDLCSEGLHYTGVSVITDENHPFVGGVEFIQSYPHAFLGHTTEKVIVRKEDIQKVIEFLQSL